MKAAIYIRGNNKSYQIEKCESFAKLQGFEILYNTDDDKNLAKWLASGNIDILIALSKSRIARNKKDYEFTEYVLRGYGVKIVTVEDNEL